jgi:exopolysaccharide biosynthesis protein
MKKTRFLAAVTALMMLLTVPALAELLDSLPMGDYSIGPAPKPEHYVFSDDPGEIDAEQIISNNKYRAACAYEDPSISVKIYTGRYATGGHTGETDYVAAHVKISHPSQLRTASANMSDANAKYLAKGTFKSDGTLRGRLIAKAVNAVVSINGDYHTKVKEHCKVVLRQGVQVRNLADEKHDLLVIDKNGDFSILEHPDAKAYASFYKENAENLYQVFCFGPALVKDGQSIISEDYWNTSLSKARDTRAQRAAIGQVGELEYLLITCSSPDTPKNDGMTVYEFAKLCQDLGLQVAPGAGCRLVYNLDGGASTTLNFLGYSKAKNSYNMMKINNTMEERFLSDIIYFATLEK